ncbi:MAG: aquaporin [Candidatus Levybacteria bacterium]|nr:aquaporin [Candidatus Levybacteria bacterium]
MQKYIVECIGTFFLVLVISLSANPLAIGAILTAMVYMGGYISGGHYNPAVTFAVFLRKKISAYDALRYVLVQFLGGFAAAIVYFLLKGEMFMVRVGEGATYVDAFFVEAFFTFALCSVVLHTATAEKNTPNQFYGLAIGFTVLAGAFSAGTISGAAFNPAVALGPILVDVLHIGVHSKEFLLYLLGPLTGALAAGFLFSDQFLGRKK